MANPKFIFDVEGHEVLLELRYLGKEDFYINEELIKTNKSFRVSGKYKFLVNENYYFIKFKVKNVFTGRIECDLYKGNELIISKHTLAKLGEKNKIISIILLLGLCGMLGYVTPKMGNWMWFSPILFIAAVVASMSCRERIYDIETKN
ncbi:hypothetical protein KCM76_23705 [Zooshikella marina]|uniref:hypothetical protein n=1 Tax=Zooshikella ganghwensis TaxID=202772 RepID=UPI001BB053AF|nr:hypothetical protein [Zooshikella ganghwensis]MBU2709022.1 hypothetical protein [Zooshikella ganghwensis]